jgi:hypothetical protein
MAREHRIGQSVSSIPYGLDRNGRPIRPWRRRKPVRIRDCFAYPLVDGPGVGMLVFYPPFLAVLAVPAFDMMVHFGPGNALNPFKLLIVPFALPVIVSFALTVGYILMFLGRVLSSTAIGEEFHPRWPTYDRVEIVEELARWIWAGMTGLAIGGLPAMAYWIHCGDPGPLDWFLFLDLAVLGVAYAEMALLAALLHESLLATNPVSVIRSIRRVGWDYLPACLVTVVVIGVDLLAWYAVLLRSPNLGVGVAGLWGCWVLTLYFGMALFRMLGALYDRHHQALDWFRTTPRSD